MDRGSLWWQDVRIRADVYVRRFSGRIKRSSVNWIDVRLKPSYGEDDEVDSMHSINHFFISQTA
jgi:hypothetical protein